jgi:hypothetical protein
MAGTCVRRLVAGRLSVVWFNNAINELKREAAVVGSFALGSAAVDQQVIQLAPSA